MPRGRKPKPKALRVLDGSAAVNPGRVNHDEPTPNGARPAMPRGLDKDSRQAWRELSGWLDGMGLLTSTDVHAMHRYCELWSAYLCLMAEFRRTWSDERCAAASRLRIVMMELNRLGGEFGLTPSARARLVAPGSGNSTPSKLEQLLA